MRFSTKAVVALAGVVSCGLALGRIVRAPGFRFSGKLAIVTGGSRGLGLSLAREILRRGGRVAICARTPDQLSRAEADLRTIAGRDGDLRVFAARCDVTSKKDVERLIHSVVEWGGVPDVLVNCAGIILAAPAHLTTDEDYQAAMAVHFWGPLYLIEELLPAMRARGEGRVVNIASIGGLVALPHLAAYSASKHALVGLSEALGRELRKSGVIVTTVCPGMMRTGSHLNARFKGHHRNEFALFSILNSTPLLSISAETAARRILNAVEQGQSQTTLMLNARLGHLANTFFPSVATGLLSAAAAFLPDSDKKKLTSYAGRESFSPAAPSLLTRLSDRAAMSHNEF